MTDLENPLKNFECQRCNQCCRQPGFVYLDAGEAERMAASLNLELYDFTGQYCQVEGRRRLVLKKHPDEACVFLTQDGCSVHAVKPRQCREFPAGWRTARSLEYCEGLRKLMAAS